ncbi:hypothetical protein CEE45_00420 [Candidatus Heimdallarchaeota archaeon B3_Heim]|nr:MAG: hypothetical protein CEE45_00420 [Candidatus Heimdallarchaeota archaeon B3_Heim]
MKNRHKLNISFSYSTYHLEDKSKEILFDLLLGFLDKDQHFLFETKLKILIDKSDSSFDSDTEQIKIVERRCKKNFSNYIHSSLNFRVLDSDEFHRFHLRNETKELNIVSNDSRIKNSLSLKFQDLEVSDAAELLEIDPIIDTKLFEDLNTAFKIFNKRNNPSVEQIINIFTGVNPILTTRMKRSKIHESLLFMSSGTSINDLISHEGNSIIDLSYFNYKERNLVANKILKEVWRQHSKKEINNKPTFIVVDEAHHLFPNKPKKFGNESTLEYGKLIAGEGRKYGIYMIISSQIPSKIHEHILTQCGNLILLQMASNTNLDVIKDTFSYVPSHFIDKAKEFNQGNALIIGRITPSPCFIQFSDKKTKEGGSDKISTWEDQLYLQ